MNYGGTTKNMPKYVKSLIKNQNYKPKVKAKSIKYKR